ncbi:MAG TPA: hypothetical protein VIV60_08025 [Polyangiaceae bacterium]
MEESRSGSQVSWTGGTCSQSCSSSIACPDGTNCIAFDDGSSLCLTRCTASDGCRTGYVCSSAVSACLPDCRLGFDCGSSLTCNQANGNCVTPVGTQVIGGKCKLNTDCKSSLCTPEQSASSGVQWKDGYCTQTCGTATSCDDSASCLTYADGSSYCVAKCSKASDCRDGYVCSEAAKACLPDCRKGWSCGSTLVCDAETGNCRGKTLPIGAACASNVDCASGICTPSRSVDGGTVWKDGYCTAECSATACPSGATCLTYADASAYCVATCSEGSVCRSGYVCVKAISACLPDCRQGWSCGSTLTCNSTDGSCQ